MSDEELQRQIDELKRQINTMSQFMGSFAEEVMRLHLELRDLQQRVAAMQGNQDNGSNGASH
ncbi:MAG: DUF4175 domain-containing protein [Coleofasciculus sp. S288]|nr:DUF4175 domain-containing protein [Coleofasciculus sp. S288]